VVRPSSPEHKDPRSKPKQMDSKRSKISTIQSPGQGQHATRRSCPKSKLSPDEPGAVRPPHVVRPPSPDSFGVVFIPGAVRELTELCKFSELSCSPVVVNLMWLTGYFVVPELHGLVVGWWGTSTPADGEDRSTEVREPTPCLLALLSLTTKFIHLVMDLGTSLVKHTSQKGLQVHRLPL
jgi:hypothetical protein